MFEQETNLDETVIDSADQTSAADESQVEGTETQDQVTGEEVSSKGAAAETPVTPGLEDLRTEMSGLNERLERMSRGYDQVMSAKQQTDLVNQHLMRQLAEIRTTMIGANSAAAEVQLRKELEELVDPRLVEPLLKVIDAKARQHAERTATQIVDQRLTASEGQRNFQEHQRRLDTANAAVREYATKKLGLTEKQYSDFLRAHPDASGRPFGWAPPEQFQEQAILMLNGQYAEKLAKIIPEVAAKAGREAAEARFKGAGAGQSTSVRMGGKDMSPTEETMAMLRSVEDDD